MLVNIGVFSLNTPLLLAGSRGWFGEAGLDVRFHQVASSEEQFADLSAERYDLVLTAFDNVLNYAVNRSNALGQTLDLKVLRAVDRGMNLSLVARDPIVTPADVRGRALAVDAPRSGFAYLAYEVLERAGLQVGRDYGLVRHGGVLHRYQRIVAGESDATLLSNGFEVLAVAAGLRVIAAPSELWTPYLGAVLAARRSWVDAAGGPVAALLGVYDRAVQATVSGAEDASLVDAIAAARGIDEATARVLLDTERSAFGLVRDGCFDREAAVSVARLRSAHGGFDDVLKVDALIDRVQPR